MLDASLVPPSSSSSEYHGDMMSMYPHDPTTMYHQELGGPYDFGDYGTPDVVMMDADVKNINLAPSSASSSSSSKNKPSTPNGGRIGKSRGRGIFPKQATNRLRQWLFQNLTVRSFLFENDVFLVYSQFMFTKLLFLSFVHFTPSSSYSSCFI